MSPTNHFSKKVLIIIRILKRWFIIETSKKLEKKYYKEIQDLGFATNQPSLKQVSYIYFKSKKCTTQRIIKKIRCPTYNHPKNGIIVELPKCPEGCNLLQIYGNNQLNPRIPLARVMFFGSANLRWPQP